MTRDCAKRIVNEAIDAVVKRESALLDIDISERALSHQLALHLTKLVDPPLSVDCEYNRYFADPKRLGLTPRNVGDSKVQPITVFPDIIVHERGSQERNYLVLELKKPGVNKGYDELKLRAFRHQLSYHHAAHVILGLDRDGEPVRDVVWIDDDECVQQRMARPT